MMVLGVKGRASAGAGADESRQIEEVDLRPLLLFTPTGSYTRCNWKEGPVPSCPHI